MADSPTSIELRVRIYHVWGVDLRMEQFSVELGLTSRWRCPASEAEAARAHTSLWDSDWTPEWTPKLAVWGTVAVLHEADKSYVSSIDAHGVLWIQCRLRLALTVTEQYELKAFPFDVQDFNLSISALNVESIEPYYAPDGAAVHLEEAGITLPDLRLVRGLPAQWWIVTTQRGSNPRTSCLLPGSLLLALTRVRHSSPCVGRRRPPAKPPRQTSTRRQRSTSSRCINGATRGTTGI